MYHCDILRLFSYRTDQFCLQGNGKTVMYFAQNCAFPGKVTCFWKVAFSTQVKIYKANSPGVVLVWHPDLLNTLRPRQMDAISQTTFPNAFSCLNENVWIPIKISLKFVPKCPINNIPAMVQIMAWRRPGDKPLSEPMMASLPTHICTARP